MGKYEKSARIITGSAMHVCVVILIIAATGKIVFPATLGSGGSRKVIRNYS